MHPQIKQDKPGQCPICAMDLIPLTTAQSSGENVDPNEIVMSESAAKLADIQTKQEGYGEIDVIPLAWKCLGTSGNSEKVSFGMQLG